MYEIATRQLGSAHAVDRLGGLEAGVEPSGLGLSIVDEVVRNHGGRVFAENRAGDGAVVGFTLPAGG
jgi:signal transduction histidine kinase